MFKPANLFFASKITLFVLAVANPVFAEDSTRYQYKAKEQTMTAIEDGTTQLKFSFFENVPNEMVTTITATYPNDTDPGLTTSINTFLIQTATQTILVDTGGGMCMGDNAGHTTKALAELKIDPAKVTDILLTHAHTDHICGLVQPATSQSNTNMPTYPNATIHISQAEHDFWVNSENGQNVKDIFALYTANKADAIKPFNPGDKLLDQFETVLTAGHTTGHIAYLWAPNDNDKWLFWGDIMHNAEMQFAHPEITIKFDTDPKQAQSTRLNIMNEAATQKWHIAGAHLPYPGVGQIMKAGADQFTWSALK